MSSWMYKIDVSDLWTQAKHDDITPQELSARLAERLKETVICRDREFGEIYRDLKDMAALATWEMFDRVLNRLYNWADDGHRLWLRTF